MRAGGKDRVHIEGGKGQMSLGLLGGGSIANPVGKGPDCAVADSWSAVRTGPDSQVRCAVSKASMKGTYSPAKAKACIREKGPYQDSGSTNLKHGCK